MMTTLVVLRYALLLPYLVFVSSLALWNHDGVHYFEGVLLVIDVRDSDHFECNSGIKQVKSRTVNIHAFRKLKPIYYY